jgi:hypothetical protein
MRNTGQIVAGGLRAIAASFPVAGSFAQAWSELENHRFQERVDSFMQDLRALVEANQAKVEALNGFILNPSSGFAELLDRAIRKVIVEADAEKRKAYALVLFNSATDSKEPDVGSKIDVLEALDTLNRGDLEILRHFSDGHPARVAELPGKKHLPPFYNVGEVEQHVGPLVPSLAKLEARGLISETADNLGAYAWAGDENFWANRWRRKTYIILPFGKKLLNYLNA